jgi:hypothetical protein
LQQFIRSISCEDGILSKISLSLYNPVSFPKPEIVRERITGELTTSAIRDATDDDTLTGTAPAADHADQSALKEQSLVMAFLERCR